MTGSAAYSLIQRSARIATRRSAVYPVTTQLARALTCRVVLYKANDSLSRRTHTFLLCTLQLRSSNLTVREPFFENSSAAVLIFSVLQLGCCQFTIHASSHPHHKTVANVYSRFSFHYFSNPQPYNYFFDFLYLSLI